MIVPTDPGACLRVQVERSFRNVQLRIRLFDFQCWWKYFVMQRQHRFEQAGRPRRGLAMANLRFH